MRNIRRSTSAIVIAVFLVSCGGNPGPVTRPTTQTNAAHYASAVLDAVTEVQKGVTSAAQTAPAFVPAAKQITGLIDQINVKARGLLDALKIYDAAVNLDAKRLAEGDVQMQISAIQVLLSQVFGIKLDASVANQIVALILNVAKTITTLSAELAKGWTVGSPTAQLPEGSAR